MSIKVDVTVKPEGKLSIMGTVDGAWFSVEGTAAQLAAITPASVFGHAARTLDEAARAAKAQVMGAAWAVIDTATEETTVTQEGTTGGASAPVSHPLTVCGADTGKGLCALPEGHQGRCAPCVYGPGCPACAQAREAARRCTNSPACARGGCDDCQRSYGPAVGR